MDPPVELAVLSLLPAPVQQRYLFSYDLDWAARLEHTAMLRLHVAAGASTAAIHLPLPLADIPPLHSHGWPSLGSRGEQAHQAWARWICSLIFTRDIFPGPLFLFFECVCRLQQQCGTVIDFEAQAGPAAVPACKRHRG